ncbi:MAG: insulinase family protein [Candidatus Eremiobacteraeota bacterium]|nr:insulinase family protein [Candidatus Eremiobacteraeota bacterium]MBV9056926.1 insulinase family protein [Candidatus Eremiobacteraeota bacterium]MBV9700064.1 insulinase family protein [Candidatus Eremiobacteraeota bacterium]
MILRLRILVLGALAAAIPLGAAAQGGPGDAGIFTTRLANGLRIVVVEDRAVPVIQSGVWYGFGSLEETPGKTGLAHALEHMLFRGTQQVSAGGLDDIIARLGARMNGETNYDYTHFYFEMPADKLDVALYVDADRMVHAAMRASDWAVERNAVLNEIDGDASSPFFNLLSRVRAAAFPGQPSGRTPLGERADVARATVADIERYYREWYAPNNATLVVAGDVNHSVVFDKAQRYFGGIASRRLPPRPNLRPTPSSGQTVEAQFPFPFEVVDLAYSVPGDTERGEPEISTLSTLLENERSPFYRALVETNIALAIEASADTQLRGGLLHVFIILNPGHGAPAAQAAFESTMRSVLENGFDADLVIAAKRMTIAERLYAADSISSLGDLTGYTYGIVGEKIGDEDARLSAITGADLLNTAKTYLSRPTVVGHLSPNASPPRRTSDKSSASATDDFSKRVPNGPIVEPSWIARATRTPTTARSILMPTTFALSNGLRVLVQPKTDRPTFVLRGSIASSPAFEAPGKEGILQLASSVADYGSVNYPFAARRKATDEIGAFLSTGQDFSAQGESRDFERIVAILADGETHPSFVDPWLQIERSQMANSLQSEESISGVMIDRAYNQLLMAPRDPALRRPSASTVQGISREELTAYTQRYWRPDLTTIAIVGDVSPQRVRSALESAFGAWRADGPRPDPRQMPLPPPTSGHDYIGTAANQVYIRLGQPAIARSSRDYDTFLVLNEILGAGGAFESRLWQELRQKRGLVYNVSSSLEAGTDRGDFRIELNAAPGRVIAAVDLVRRELERLQQEPVSSTELQEAKVRLVGNALLDEASSGGQARQLLDIATNNLPTDYYRTLNDRFASITAADVHRVAREYLRPNRLVEVFAGPSGPWSQEAI